MTGNCNGTIVPTDAFLNLDEVEGACPQRYASSDKYDGKDTVSVDVPSNTDKRLVYKCKVIPSQPCVIYEVSSRDSTICHIVHADMISFLLYSSFVFHSLGRTVHTVTQVPTSLQALTTENLDGPSRDGVMPPLQRQQPQRLHGSGLVSG